MMTNLEKVTKRIQNLVPDIMELKMGCWVDSSTGSNSIHRHKLTRDLQGAKFNKILGRDITLEDILVAIEKEGDMKLAANLIWYHSGHGAVNDPDYRWKLNTPFHLQSKELIDFVYQLICKD